MAEEKENKKSADKGKRKTGSFIKEILSGSMVSERIILRNLGYVSLVTLLLAFYIGNRFHAEKITRQMTRLTREVKDLRAESLATSADLMQLSRQSEVYRLVRERGISLEEMKSPPYRLIVSSKRESEWQSEMK